MATAGVPLWSTTATNNANADPEVNWAEGMAPSAVNNSARSMMASVAKWRNDLSGIATAGSSTAYTVSTGATFASAADMSGMIFSIVPHATSGASPTLSVDGLTARAINESAGVAVATGALVAGTPYLVKYVHASTEFILLGRSSVFTTVKATSNIIAAPGTTAGRPSAVAGGFRFNTDTSLPEFSDGANWFSLLATLSGAQMPYGAVINGTITVTANSPVSNSITFTLKTLAGNDPSPGDPILLAFRNSTAATGNYVYKAITSALPPLVISSGSSLGATDATAFKLWFVLFNDGGTVKLAAINCVSGSSIYRLGQFPVADAIAEGGAGGADNAQKFYAGTTITAMPYVILGYATYESGLSIAGNWNISPTNIQLYGAGVPLPGSCIQSAYNSVTTTTLSSGGATIQTSLTASITPTSKCSLIKVQAFGNMTGGLSSGIGYSVQLSRGTSPTLIGNVSGLLGAGGNGGSATANIAIDKPQTTSSQSYYVYLSQSSAGGQITFLNQGAGVMQLEEIAA